MTGINGEALRLASSMAPSCVKTAAQHPARPLGERRPTAFSVFDLVSVLRRAKPQLNICDLRARRQNKGRGPISSQLVASTTRGRIFDDSGRSRREVSQRQPYRPA